jgi:hypothetical protein
MWLVSVCFMCSRPKKKPDDDRGSVDSVDPMREIEGSDDGSGGSDLEGADLV